MTPVDASIDTLTVSQDTVWTGSQIQAVGPLGTPGTVGLVNLTGRALTTHAVSDWQDALSKLRGIADVQFTIIAISDDNGIIYYAVSATFTLTPDAFANQFVTEK